MKKSCLVLGATFTLLLATSLHAAEQKVRKPGLYAVFETSMGSFVCELYEKTAPLAVENFVGLAKGTKEWLSPKGQFMKNAPYYNGIIFHRVIKGFMIQGGDVTGKGTFNPVLPFKDEIVPTLRFDKAGVLAMANSGPNTNGSQFFITVGPQPHLDGKHTILGRVVEGFKFVEAISEVPVSPGGRPLKDVLITKITIDRVAKSAR
jgi:peptidyl-prolyl cis-trans isomerase A (cyclophilin A)